MLDKVNVGIRCRPASGLEILEGEETHDFFKGNDTNTIATLKNKFKFNHLFNEGSTQGEVFDKMVKPLLDKVLHGFNATILAYGQTGSGKTYTMGTELMNENPGVTQMVLQHLFKRDGIHVKISVFEIYKEQIFDLLHQTPQKISVQDVKTANTAAEIFNLENAQDLIKKATRNRRVAETIANKNSSRSHMIISLSVNTSEKVAMSKLNLVDLAGSEKVVDGGTQRNEGVAINVGLLGLLRVVHSLSQGSVHIPYRDSRLTHILEDSLSTNNFIALVACINSLKKNMEETEKTLDFASKFAGIEVTPIVVSSSRIYGTPFKTPQKFVNKTFSSTGESCFKKPLTPFNKTIAITPTHRTLKRKEISQETSGIDFRRSSTESLNLFNLSNVSTSTTISSSPPLEGERKDLFTSVLSTPAFAGMTPANFDDFIKKTVERAVKTTKKQMTQLFLSKLNKPNNRKENDPNWNKRLSEIGLDDRSLNDSFPMDDSDSDASVLQTTVYGPNENDVDMDEASPSGQQVLKIPQIPKNKENVNGSYLSDIFTPDQKRETDFGVSSEPQSDGFKQPAVRRSMRLSRTKRSFYDMAIKETPDNKDRCTNSSQNLDSGSEVLKKPLVRRSMRRSVLRRAVDKSDSDSDATPDKKGRDTDSSLNSETGSELFKKPIQWPNIRRSVLRRTFKESNSDETSDDESGSHSKPRRSMRLSILKRATDMSPEKKVPKSSVRKSYRVSLARVDEGPTQKVRKPTSKEDVYADLPHEKRVLKILKNGDVKDLIKLPTVGIKTAALIVNHRELYGPLKSVRDFAKIRGLTENQSKKFLWANSLD